MFKISLGNNRKLIEENAALKRDLDVLLRKIKLDEREAMIALKEALLDQAKSMSADLIKSDLMRVEAVAKLEVYEKHDTKQDANTLRETMVRLIDVIGKHQINIVK